MCTFAQVQIFQNEVYLFTRSSTTYLLNACFHIIFVNEFEFLFVVNEFIEKDTQFYNFIQFTVNKTFLIHDIVINTCK